MSSAPMKWKRVGVHHVSSDYVIRTKIGVGVMEGQTRYAAYWQQNYFGSAPTLAGAKHICSDHAEARTRNTPPPKDQDTP